MTSRLLQRFFFLLAFSGAAESIAQDVPKNVLLSDVVVQAIDSPVFLRDYDVFVDDPGVVLGFMDPSVVPKDSLDRTILHNIHFEECRFIGAMELENYRMGMLSLSLCTGPKLTLINVALEQAIRIDNSSFPRGIEIFRAETPDLGVFNNSAGEILIRNSRISGPTEVGDNGIRRMAIEANVFDMGGFWFNNYVIENPSSYHLELIENEFLGEDGSFVELKGSYSNLNVEGNRFQADLFFTGASVEKRFKMSQNVIDRNVSFEDFIFSETRNELYWDQFAGYKLAYSSDGVIYKAQSTEELEDEASFKNLVSSYKSLHTIFSTRGDLESANACYSEMREMQGKQLKHRFLNNPGFPSFYRWMLNRLLKFYVNHGTDPALAAVISFWVIVGFAILYMFFPSEWDREKSGRLTEYFQSVFKQQGRQDQPIQGIVKGTSVIVLNAITLSLNSFVTLGFGSIPTRGLARYLCIVEGFLGWFLLSIFTVALINQVLA